MVATCNKVKFLLVFFGVICLLAGSFCVSNTIDKKIFSGMVEEGVHADSLSVVYTNLKTNFNTMAKTLEAIPEAAKKSVPNYPEFESRVKDYTEKMFVYDDDLRQMSQKAQSFAKAVEEGKYTKATAKEEYEKMKSEVARIGVAVTKFNKALEVLSGPYQQILNNLPEGGKILSPSEKKQ